MRAPSILLILAASCTLDRPDDVRDDANADARPATPPPPVVTTNATPESPPGFEVAPTPSLRRQNTDLPTDIATKIDGYFDGWGTRRLYVQLDRPLYRPGETVWIKTFSVQSRRFAADPQQVVTYELVDPQGVVVETKAVGQENGAATNDFELGPDVAGGQWTLRARLPSGETDERHFVVSSYQTPRLRKTLDFIRQAYGPGDTVEALIEIERTTGGALADHPVHALLQVDGQTAFEADLTTDATGAVFVAAPLGADLRSSDALLTLLVEDGGVTESISRSVPITLADVALAFFPEGGDLVRGLPGRVYFEAKNAHGEPADVRGVVEDDTGAVVADFESLHDGLGRFAFTPEPGRRYRARITEPAGLDATYALPDALVDGCTLRAYDDVDSEHRDVRVAVRCSAPKDVLVAGVLKESVLDHAAVRAGPTEDAVVYLAAPADRASEQGAVRVTVFDHRYNAVAERLVYRNAGRDLGVTLTTDRASYGPRDEVVVTVTTTNPDGSPVPAELALSVVDDNVLSFADDEEGHILSRLYLDPELTESPDDPAWYFDDDEALASRGLDLVMGTKGYRRFEWQTVWNPPVPVTTATGIGGLGIREDLMFLAAEGRGMAALPMAPPMEVAAAPLDDHAEFEPMPDAAAAVAPPMAEPMAIAAAAPMAAGGVARAEWARGPGLRDLAGDGLDALGYLDGGVGRQRAAWGGMATSTVRVFPKPDYSAGFTGVRTDFRDTVHWEPTVQTDNTGRAEVRFYLSDAITQFRLTAEGLGAGAAGHGEATVRSVLPVSLATTLPVAVSSGDVLFVPLTATNTRDDALRVDVSGVVDSRVVTATSDRGTVTVEPNGSATHWMELTVGPGRETAQIHLTASGGGVSDAMTRTLKVVPPGFPRSVSEAGQMTEQSTFTVHVDEWVEGSLTAKVSWQPSTMATLLTGMEALIQTPGGCFEQTSSTNWPNVAILKYLEAHDGDPRIRAQSSQALDAGYTKLTGYQVDAGGFETWGSGPGKEVLSAFGLLQFADMQAVYPVAPAVLTRDATYLLAQRDGRGGFRNSGESAHGYGSAPASVLDGFITWSLVATGHGGDLRTEVARQAEVARASRDPYVLALATRVLVGTGHPGADAAAERLAGLQAADGAFPGAESSITRSYEANLDVESTALAALALMESGKHRSQADKAAAWLVENRRGVGSWGATQATALALGALSKHAEVSRVPKTPGRVSIEVNGERVGALDYAASQTAALEITGWERHLRPGANTVVLRQESGEPLPFTLDVSWTSVTPTSAPDAELALTTSLDRERASMGETVRLTAEIDNRTDRVVPSPIARIGLPAGLEAQTWQLQQLQDRGVIAFFETREREVTLYWDGLHPNDGHEVQLDLVATVPGVFTGPASSAYPYYDDDEMAWQPGLAVRIDR
jgi:hypothetical protein